MPAKKRKPKAKTKDPYYFKVIKGMGATAILTGAVYAGRLWERTSVLPELVDAKSELGVCRADLVSRPEHAAAPIIIEQHFNMSEFSHGSTEPPNSEVGDSAQAQSTPQP